MDNFMPPDFSKEEIKEALIRNYMLAVKNIQKQTDDILERFDRLLYPKKYLALALEKMEKQKLELIEAWEKWTDTYENTVWENETQREFYEIHRDAIGNEIEYFENQIKLLSYTSGNTELPSGWITPADVERANATPIENIIEIPPSGKILCKWHSEKTASCHFWKAKNRLHCFGECSKSFSVIDLVRNIKSCSLVEAVKMLSGK
ncbi:MAG: CHC2 zinc finger domain-containing protein [Patescibacteria group bacterium]|nr:CHC2 zinc finger domain-containing protein [Patescibacteria group bacterium]